MSHRLLQSIVLASGFALAGCGGECTAVDTEGWARLVVVDSATSAPVGAGVTFAVDSNPAMTWTCEDYLDAGSGCASWHVYTRHGPHMITVAAPGYVSQTITVDPGTQTIGGGPCGTTSVHHADATVRLVAQ